jgi:hypothetical protein
VVEAAAFLMLVAAVLADCYLLLAFWDLLQVQRTQLR